jgi:pimeloyl-ACP methyl ester carboxylesterase
MARQHRVKRPSLFWLMTESGRAFTEYSTFLPYQRLSSATAPDGDEHPVLLLPGFMATDLSTRPLRSHLRKLGYTALPWGMGRNTGRVEFLDSLNDKLQQLYDTYQEPVSLIGWSLGGVFARQMAKAHPELVRQVVTLGSPFRGIGQPNNVAWVYNWFTGRERVQDIDPNILNDLPFPAPVPTTAIYSKQDGIVPWQLCMEAEETSIHQNIEVRGSHLGMGFNPSVLRIITDRLQYQRHNWVHFDSQGFVDKVILYPSLSTS